jgi:hypothetical protein
MWSATIRAAIGGTPVERLAKWWAGNDIWAMAIVDVSSDKDSQDIVPAEIQQVLDEYKDVFDNPQGLPPERERERERERV